LFSSSARKTIANAFSQILGKGYAHMIPNSPTSAKAFLSDDGSQSRDETYVTTCGTHAERRKSIIRCIIDAGPHGITVDEISERLGVPPNAISGRVTELKRQGLCRHTEARRRTRAGSSASVIVVITGGR
jgi:DNA-binding IclR family transcriptional regulator